MSFPSHLIVCWTNETVLFNFIAVKMQRAVRKWKRRALNFLGHCFSRSVWDKNRRTAIRGAMAVRGRGWSRTRWGESSRPRGMGAGRSPCPRTPSGGCTTERGSRTGTGEGIYWWGGEDHPNLSLFQMHITVRAYPRFWSRSINLSTATQGFLINTFVCGMLVEFF